MGHGPLPVITFFVVRSECLPHKLVSSCLYPHPLQSPDGADDKRDVYGVKKRGARLNFAWPRW